MEATTKTSADRKCDLCPRSMDCSNLFLASTLIQTAIDTRDPLPNLQKYLNFQSRLNDLHFDYPEGQKSCLLVQDESRVRELIIESIELIEELQRRLQTEKSMQVQLNAK